MIVRRSFLICALIAAHAARPLRAQSEPVRLTAEEAVRRALATSHLLRARHDEVDATRSGLSAEIAELMPRLSVAAQYAGQHMLDTAGLNVPAFLNFPTFPTGVLTRRYVRTTLTVPLSDYPLRLRPLRAAGACTTDASERAEESAALETGTAARVAYYEWSKASLRAVFAEQVQRRANAHLGEGMTTRLAGGALDADVLRLRADSAIAAAALSQATGDAEVAAAALQTLLHDPLGTRYDPAAALGSLDDDATSAAASSSQPLTSLLAEADRQRPEPRELDATAAALTQRVRAERGAAMPQVELFGEVLSANPHPDLVSITNNRYTTWEIGVRGSWSTSALMAGASGSRAARARAAAATEEAAALRDSLHAEVIRAYTTLRQARVVIAARRASIAAASEARVVRASQLRNGQATPAQLADSESEMASATLELHLATIDARIAEARLSRAVGRGAPGSTSARGQCEWR